jgi:hypothetical protein
VLVLLAAVASLGGRAPTRAGDLEENVTFSEYSPLSRSLELARRMLTPLSFQRLQQHLASTPDTLREQPIDLARERFLIYVPSTPAPAEGYGLLVFVPALSAAALPSGWGSVLDHHAMIYVSAAHSGNDTNVYDRRVPLALLAYQNIRSRYPLNPNRVYVGGISGGSRAALIIALAYPDVFHGALLNAGSDPLGEQGIRIPPADLLHQFQESTRLIYVTGERDEFNLHQDLLSRESMHTWCVFDLDTQVVPHLEHEIAPSAALDRALQALEQPVATDPNRLAQCRSQIDRKLAAAVADATATIERGDAKRARVKIDAIDQRYGGLAAPMVLGLDARLAKQP